MIYCCIFQHTTCEDYHLTHTFNFSRVTQDYAGFPQNSQFLEQDFFKPDDLLVLRLTERSIFMCVCCALVLRCVTFWLAEYIHATVIIAISCAYMG